MPSTADREKALEAALAQIDRQFGKGTVMRLGSDERAPVAVIPTGSIALDVALGIGGLPRGRIVEIYGPESSGKTTLTLHAIANAQRAGGIAAFIDAEHALDPEYAAKLGVDIDSLLVSQPDTGEQALEIADMLVRSGSIDLIVIDSVAALVPRAEIEGEMGDSHVGLQARLMSQALRKLTRVGLRDEEVVDVNAELGSVVGVERVLGIDEGGDTARALHVRDGVEGEGRLAGGLRSVDLDDAPARQAADAERDVEGDGARGDHGDRCALVRAEAHDGAFAELTVDLGESGFEGLLAVGG